MPSRSSGGKLTSLAPEFVDDDHYTYFKRLEEVVRWPKNLNIALSGSYGTGKSSVLEGFEREHGRKALRLAISSFGPSRGEESLTNRIQRELVKQLVYSASPGTRRRSRFRTPENLRWWRAPLEALGVVALIGTFGFLMGWLPVFSGAVALSHPVLSTILWVLVASVLVYVGAVVRIATHGRFMVSHLSAAGATFGLSERTHTYFDQYLDEIVNYFDNEPVTFVIFEDIDRFNDPDIFQALRDLNTLLNLRRSRADAAGPHAPDEPLRFIYAVRDSVFELLGSNRKQKKNDDAATAETVRANRTKFFDVVVPMVPFISHRNARDHLVGLLETAKIFEVKRDLVDMVALRCTDMRLLRNMCNEYLVFSERLLLPAKSAPGLSPSGLFALVAYKSFHLKDFEDISRGASQLDRLYNLRREFVRDCIKGLEDEVRNLKSGEERVRTGEELARKLGGRLNSFAEVIKKGSTKFSDGSPVSYKIGELQFSPEQSEKWDFWDAVAEAKTLSILADSQNTKNDLVGVFDAENLDVILPEFRGGDCLIQFDKKADARLKEISDEMATLRGADFAKLAGQDKFEMRMLAEVPNEDKKNKLEGEDVPQPKLESVSFDTLITRTMKSELAVGLVKSGYIDRNFALYAAQFYGDFNGLEVPNFLVRSAQTNTMDFDYKFKDTDTIRNLLAEADDDFTHTHAAYNLDILNYLLEEPSPLIHNVVFSIVADMGEDARSLLASYFTTGKHPDRLAGLLSGQPWLEVFDYLVKDEGVPADARVALVSAALGSLDTTKSYLLNTAIGDFVVANYADMDVFVKPQEEPVREGVLDVLDRLDLTLPDLEPIGEELRERVIANGHYKITSENLRLALGPIGNAASISLDELRKGTAVYEHCVRNLDEYLTAVEDDAASGYAIEGGQTLIDVLIEVAREWEVERVDRLLSSVFPGAMLSNIRDVPIPVWESLAAAKLFRATLANIDSYRQEVGSIDIKLAELLEHAGVISVDDPTDTVNPSGEKIDGEATALAILNAPTLTSPSLRVALVKSLKLEEPLPIKNIHAEEGDLLACLIKHKVVTDESEAFEHFHLKGWAAIGPAIAASEKIVDFIAPGLLRGMIGDMFGDAVARAKLGLTVVQRADDFILDDDIGGWTAVAQYAEEHSTPLSPDNVQRIAVTEGGKDQRRIISLLAGAFPAASADQIIAIFSALGDPYGGISQSKSTFDVNKDSQHETLLNTLKAAGLCDFKKKRSADQFTVTSA